MSIKRNLWLAAASALAIVATVPVRADDDAIVARIDAMQRQLEAQQKEIAAQKAEIDRLRASVGGKKPKAEPPSPAPAAVTDTATRAELDTLRTRVAENETRARLEKQEQPVWSFVNLRPTVQSPDGRFTLSLRGQIQFDMANYFQDDPRALNVDFRRGSGRRDRHRHARRT